MLSANFHSRHIDFDPGIDDIAVEASHLRDRGQLVHPDAGEIRLAVGRPRRRRGQVRFTVARAGRSRRGKVQPLRVHARGHESQKPEHDQEPLACHRAFSSDRLRHFARTRAELRSVRLALEVRGQHERQIQIGRVVHDGRENQPRVAVWFAGAIEEFREHGVGAVRYTVPPQIARLHPRRHHLQGPAECRGDNGRVAASARRWREALALPDRLPTGEGQPLPARRAARRRRRLPRREVEQPDLVSVVDVYLQRAVVLPRDVQAHRQPHDARGAERAALFAGGDVFRRIPRVGRRRAVRVERHARVVAFGRRHHPEAPVLGNRRCPITSQIDRRRLFGRPRRLGGAAASL